MAMEPNRRVARVPKRASLKPKPVSNPQSPRQADQFGTINRGDRGDSDRTSYRSHRDR